MQRSVHRKEERSQATRDQTEPISCSRGQDKQTEPTGVYVRGLTFGEVEPWWEEGRKCLTSRH